MEQNLELKAALAADYKVVDSPATVLEGMFSEHRDDLLRSMAEVTQSMMGTDDSNRNALAAMAAGVLGQCEGFQQTVHELTKSLKELAGLIPDTVKASTTESFVSMGHQLSALVTFQQLQDIGSQRIQLNLMNRTNFYYNLAMELGATVTEAGYHQGADWLVPLQQLNAILGFEAANYKMLELRKQTMISCLRHKLVYAKDLLESFKLDTEAQDLNSEQLEVILEIHTPELYLSLNSNIAEQATLVLNLYRLADRLESEGLLIDITPEEEPEDADQHTDTRETAQPAIH